MLSHDGIFGCRGVSCASAGTQPFSFDLGVTVWDAGGAPGAEPREGQPLQLHIEGDMTWTFPPETAYMAGIDGLVANENAESGAIRHAAERPTHASPVGVDLGAPLPPPSAIEREALDQGHEAVFVVTEISEPSIASREERGVERDRITALGFALPDPAEDDRRPPFLRYRQDPVP